jgi:5-(carboxyamino)imidazole ribonucleotide synthase
LDDPAALADLLSTCDRVTLENEFVPAAALREALARAGRGPDAILPGIETLATIQDKLEQRRAYARSGVPSPVAVALDSAERVAREIGFPMVLKARFGGYDGKGTRFARTPLELDAHRALWSGGGWLAEAYVPFVRELAVMVYRGPRGTGTFGTVETIQTNHVCDLVFPCDTDASAVAIRAVEAVGGQGLFGVELFELENGEAWVNEIAPRPHNSGHYSLDGWSLSQFQAHVMLCLGLDVPAPRELAPVVMANLLGQSGPVNVRTGLAALGSESRLHWYGKLESRPGRKMGHLNVLGEGSFTPGLVALARAERERFFRSRVD